MVTARPQLVKGIRSSDQNQNLINGPKMFRAVFTWHSLWLKTLFLLFQSEVLLFGRFLEIRSPEEGEKVTIVIMVKRAQSGFSVMLHNCENVSPNVAKKLWMRSRLRSGLPGLCITPCLVGCRRRRPFHYQVVPKLVKLAMSIKSAFVPVLTYTVSAVLRL